MKTKRPRVFADDISTWKDGASLILDRVSRMKAEPEMMRSNRERLDALDPLRVYALLVEFIAPQPNGFMTHLIQGMPADNLVWWDFALAGPQHFVTVMNGVNGLEADVYDAPQDFRAERLLATGCEKYRDRVDKRIRSFERHEIYANAFYSYRNICEWLRSELRSFDPNPPRFQGGIRLDNDTAVAEFDALKTYGPTAIRCHVLAKNLLMNSAFMCEALITTLLRLGAQRPLVVEPDVLRPLLRSPFMQKVEVLHAYTILFTERLDTNAAPVKAVRTLMEKRNKLVHAEESQHTRLDDVYFDGDFPLYGPGADGQLANFYKRTFLVPSPTDALAALDAAEKFVIFVMERVRTKMREEIKFLLKQPQLGYNTKKRMYSVPFPTTTFQTFFTAKGDPAKPEESPDE